MLPTILSVQLGVSPALGVDSIERPKTKEGDKNSGNKPERQKWQTKD
jgi:hypothetical protein